MKLAILQPALGYLLASKKGADRERTQKKKCAGKKNADKKNAVEEITGRQYHLPASKNPAGTFDRKHEKTAVQKCRSP
jgi:hypothetical protein